MVVVSPAQQNRHDPRLVAISSTGRYAVIRQAEGLGIVDAMGTAPRRSVELAEIVDFTCVGKLLWVVSGGKLERYRLESAQRAEQPVELGGEKGQLVAAPARIGRGALWLSEVPQLLLEIGDQVEIHDISSELGGETFVAPLGGRRMLLGRPGRIRIRDAGRGDVVATPIPEGRAPEAASALFGGKAIAVLCRGETNSALVVLRANGSLIHVVEVATAVRCAFAEHRGLALMYTEDNKLTSVDLRYGRVLSRVDPPIPVSDLAIDADGKNLIVAGWDQNDQLSVLHIPYIDLFNRDNSKQRSASAGNGAAEAEDATEPEPEPEPEPEQGYA